MRQKPRKSRGIGGVPRLTPVRSPIYTTARRLTYRRQPSYAGVEKGAFVNKNELVDAVAVATDLRKADAAKAVDAVFDSIADSLKKGDEVRVVGFGTFAVSNRAASEGRNPRTGEKITIPASKQPKFKAGKQLKDAIQ
jgi:DNA-binding protein HU-beta